MTPDIAKAIWALGAVGWFVIRYPHQRRSRRTAIKKRHLVTRERVLLSISLIGLGIIPAIYLATNLGHIGDRPFVPARAWAGAAVFALSLYVFRRTHKDLGRNWSVTLEMREQHKLITEGIYALVRHPMYTAFFLWAIAQALLLPNWIAGLSGLVGFGTLYAFRVGREEEMMLETFGQEYRDYMARTKRLVPGIY